MKKLIGIIVIIGGFALFVHLRHAEWLADYLPKAGVAPVFADVPDLRRDSPWIAAQGRIEPVSEERRLSFEVNGVISAVFVKEGDPVTRGEVLAQLKDDDYLAGVEAAKAEARAKLAYYDKLVAGARVEEKSEAWAVVKRSKSVMENARKEMDRRQELLRKNLIAKEDVDRAITDFHVANNEYQEAIQRHLITKNQSRKEDLDMAWAEYDAASKQVAKAEAELDKTRLHSPVNGHVLKKHRSSGEIVSLFFDSPVLTVGDLSEYQVRTEVDEKFASLVAIGQQAYFTSETYGGTRFPGVVSRVATMTSRKKIDLGSPEEKTDIKVIEVIVRLDDSRGLLTGLTGDVFIKARSGGNRVSEPVQPGESNATPPQ